MSEFISVFQEPSFPNRVRGIGFPNGEPEVLMRSSPANKRVIKSTVMVSRRPLEDEDDDDRVRADALPMCATCIHVRDEGEGNLAPSVHKQNGP